MGTRGRVFNKDSILAVMCVLPDHEILDAIEAGRMGIDVFSDRCLTPNGYDLRIAEISLEGGEAVTEGEVEVPPGRLFFVSTLERVTLPDDVTAQLWLRTSWIRKGLVAGLGKVDAGFSGTLTFSAFNLSGRTVRIPIGERFVQIVFERMSSAPRLTYEKRSGNYQGQRGITLEPRRC